MYSIKLFLTILMITFTAHSYAQFGNLKIKAPKKPKLSVGKSTKVTTSAPEAPSVESNRNKDGSPKHDSENPIYKAYSKAKEGLLFSKGPVEGFEAKQNPEKAREDATKYLAKTKEQLDFLNGQDSEKDREYLTQFNAEYKRLEELHLARNGKADEFEYHENRLKEYRSWVKSDIPLESKDLEPTVRGYDKTKAAFAEAQPEAMENGNIKFLLKDIDEYFDSKVYQTIDWIEDDVDRDIKELHRVHLGREVYILNADNYVKSLKKPIDRITYYKDNLMRDPSKAEALLAKIEKETTMLEEYINSGKFAANLAKYEQEVIDSRLLRQGMKDGDIEGVAKAKLPKKYGQIVRVTVASTGWGVNKNALGIPLDKALTVDFAVKRDGKCYYISATIGRTYEGGGKYGSMWLSDDYEKGEMNCNNVNKNR